MTKAYSDDLRVRVVNTMKESGNCRSISDVFGVAPSSVVKWTQRYDQTGSVSPAKVGGYRRSKLAPHHDFILEQIEATSHLTLHGLKDKLAERGVKVSHDTVWRFLRAKGLSFKKNTVCH
jgi:transposase